MQSGGHPTAIDLLVSNMKTKLKLSHTYPPLLRFLRSRYSRKLPLLALLGITPGLQAQTWTAPATAQTNATKKAEEQKAVRHEVSLSADYLYGLGKVGIPFNFSGALGESFDKQVNEADRKSSFYGATLSYSVSQAWYVDASFATGKTTGTMTPDALSIAMPFTIDESTYQGFMRYNFPGLRGKRFSAYMRLGLTYTQADVTGFTDQTASQWYGIKNTTEDLLGNLGFGMSYTLFTGLHARLAAQAEGEGFFGQRSQSPKELLVAESNIRAEETSFENLVGGGVGRVTLRYQYRFGGTGRLRAFVDAGVQGKYTAIHYKGVGTFNELLWGPYTRVGLGYSF